MKHLTWVILSLSILLVGCDSERSGNKISLIAELPNTKEYAIDGKFVDIGIVYNTTNIEGLSVYNFNKRWCLFSGNSYWVIEKERIDEIAASAGITLQSNLALPFWDEWGGRILFIGTIIVIILGFIIWSKIQPKLKVLKPISSNLNYQNAGNLIFDGHYKVKKYNGTNVKWHTPFAFTKAVSILLPPGECSIIFDFVESDGDKKNIASDHNTKGIIQAGKTYFLKSFLNDLDNKKILATYVVEGKDNDKKEYGTSTGVTRASWCITRVGTNITPDKANQFINEYCHKIKNDGFNFVDERGQNAGILYNEFNKYPVSILDGEIYSYKTFYNGISWLLLISRGELGIMLSFNKNKIMS